MNEEQQYLNFDEYIKASEPHKRELGVWLWVCKRLRNALVRANYKNVAKGIGQDYSF